MFRNINIKKITILVTSLILTGMITMGSTYAFYHHETEVLTNTFTVGEITTMIVETFDKEWNKAPQVKNTDVTDCIVRMRYDISPSNAPVKPIDFNTNWIEQGGFYYYKGVLKGATQKNATDGGITQPLFTKYELKDYAKDFLNEYGNKFEIILYQEAVQAEMVDNEGNIIKALNENGNWDDESARKIWYYYDNHKDN